MLFLTLNQQHQSSSEDNIYGAVAVAQGHCKSSPGSLDECRLRARWLPTLRPSQKHLDCESADRLLPSTSTIAIAILLLLSPKADTILLPPYSFHHPAEGRRLSRPRHCSKGVQPVPKAVYSSGRHDKHKCLCWVLNLGFLILQSDMLASRQWPV